MRVSFNEIEGTVLKAARGAGYPWGLAEEASRAARFLAASGLPWLETAAAAFSEAAVRAIGGDNWQLNPIAAAAWYADFGGAKGGAFSGARMLAPVWFAGVLAVGTGRIGEAMAISWIGHDRPAKLVIWRGALVSAEGALAATEATTFECRVVGPAVAAVTDCHVDERRWAALQALEKNTYVPASDHSRIAGAGAGLVDND
ncbi:MAG TPA: DUF3726 domain-containing protein [Hyphomicrobiaceae bacterium]|nr:DUF3726 domain-containing protein [Hyphomicrobiaceae bacterium]